MFYKSIIFSATVWIFLFTNLVNSAEVKYKFDHKTGIGELTSGRLKVLVNEAGINGITIDGYEVIGDIYPAVLGAKYKNIADNSSSSNLISKDKLKLIQKAGDKYILIRNVFGSASNGSAVSERRLSLSPQGMLTVKCIVDVSRIRGTIAQQRIVTVMGRQYADAAVSVTDKNGNITRLNKFSGSYINPQMMVFSFGASKWSFDASRVDPNQKLIVQLYKSYRRVINATVFSGKSINITLKYDFSQLLKQKLKVVQAPASAKKINDAIISGDALKKVSQSDFNLLENSSFESGLYGWRPVISTADNTWIIDRNNNRHGTVCLKYSGTGTRHEGIYSHLYPKKSDYYTVSAWIRGTKKDQYISLGIGGAPAPPRVRLKYQCLKKVGIGKTWKKYSVTVKIPKAWKGINSVYAVIMPDSKTDVLFIDDAGLYGGVPEDDINNAVPFGIITVIERLGNVFEQSRSGKIKIEIIRPEKINIPLKLSYLVFDFWGNQLNSGTKKIAVSNKDFMEVNTKNTGSFHIVFSLKNNAGKILAKNTTRYCVMSDQSKADRSMFGMNFHMERPDVEQLDKTLKLLSFAGVGSIRAWWDWGIAEPRKGQYNWKTFDDQVRLSHKHNIELLSMIGRVYGPKWTGSKKAFAPPDNMDDWNNYVEKVVSRYKGKVKYWEVWNEPDIAFKIKNNPLVYVELLKRAYKTIKSIDPDAKVVGVCGSFMKFIEPVIRAEALNYMDIFSYHCYSLKYNPGTALPVWLARVERLIKKYGKGRKIPLWNTEVGVGDDRNGYVRSEEDRRRICGIMARNYLIAKATGTQNLFWFSVDFHSTYTHSIIDYRLLPSPAMVTYNALVRLLGGTDYLGKISCAEKENFYALKFKKTDDNYLIAFWYNGFPAERTLNINGNLPGIKLYDVVGAPIDINNKKLQLKTSFPVFLTGSNLQSLENVIKASRFAVMRTATEKPKAGKAFPVKPVLGPFNITNQGFIIDWRLFGPFADPGGRGYAKGIDKDYLSAFGSEKNAVIGSKMQYKYDFVKMTGKKFNLTLKPVEYHGASAADYYQSKTFINLKTSLQPDKYAVAYAFCYINAPADMEAQLRIGSDDGCKIWLNNSMVLRRKVYRAAVEDNDIADVRLKKGINTLLIKITQDVGGWGFYCRLTDRQGDPIKKIKIWL
jgi:carbohydrate binding protein with CBM4/9 domain/glycosyl hydrolase family 39 (putative alpha-L-iduronidase)